MSFNIRPFTESDSCMWDSFSKGCIQATFQHTRGFLSYHEDRFVDRSLIVELHGTVVGLFSAAESLDDDLCIVSHPGATYGGLIHKGDLYGELMIGALQSICTYYFDNKYKRIIYKAVPSIYHKAPACDDIYALFRLKFLRFRCDLSSTIDLDNRLKISERRNRGVKKALKNNIIISEDGVHLSDLWMVLESNLHLKHGVSPTHSLEEIKQLMRSFPEEISCVCGIMDGNVVAGVVLFCANNCMHAQYICSSEKGGEVSALDLIFEYCIQKAKDLSIKWFDFGISTEDQGMKLNYGLYKFKKEFGAGSVVHEFYELSA